MPFQNEAIVALITITLLSSLFSRKAREFFVSVILDPDLVVFILKIIIKNNPRVIKNNGIKSLLRSMVSENELNVNQQIKLRRNAEKLISDLKHTVMQIDPSIMRACIYFETNGQYDAHEGFSIRKLNMSAEEVNKNTLGEVPYIEDIMKDIPVENLPYRYEQLSPYVPALISLYNNKKDSTDLPYLENAMWQRLRSYQVREIMALLVTDINGRTRALIELHFKGISYSKIEAIKSSFSAWTAEADAKLSSIE